MNGNVLYETNKLKSHPKQHSKRLKKGKVTCGQSQGSQKRQYKYHQVCFLSEIISTKPKSASHTGTRVTASTAQGATLSTWKTTTSFSPRPCRYSECLKSGHLSVPISDVRLRDLCSKIGTAQLFEIGTN